MLILIYLTSNVDSFFLAKSLFMRSPECRKEKLLTKNEEESSLVAEGGLLRDPQLGGLISQKPCSRPGGSNGLFVSIISNSKLLSGCQQKSPGAFAPRLLTCRQEV